MPRLILSAFFFGASLAFSALTLGPAVLALSFLGLRRQSEALRAVIMRIWGRYAVLVAGGRVRVEGRENLPASDNVCFYANHQDYSDIVVLLGWLGKPVGFLGKKELGMVPIMSSWMILSHSLFLDRKSIKQGVRTVHRAASNLKKGRPLVIFPEGTRNHGGPVAEFRAGSFKAAKLAGGLIVPVTVDGSWRFMGTPGKVRGGRVRVVIHPAIDSAALGPEEWKELPRRVHDLIEGAIRLTPEKEGLLPR
jgi:1-acyl-sn-glycerol-3-phosphate acyltransferase